MHKMALYMHVHYLLKLTASLVRVRKQPCILLYLCESFVLYLMRVISALWPRSVVHLSWIIYAEIVLPELF